VIDRILHLVMICVVVGSDCLPCSVSYCNSVRCSESWTLVPADHTRPIEDLHDCFVIFPTWAQNSFDSKHWRSGDINMVQHIPQSVDGDQSFISSSLDLVGIVVHLLLLEIAQRSAVLIIFSLIIFFFIVVLMVIVVVIVVVVAIVLRQLLSFFAFFLSFFSHRYHDHDLKRILLLRNILRRVKMRVLLRWHISWDHLTNWLMSSALAGYAVRTNNLKFGNRRE
jgi:cellulose synthase/poly-beta-1,6-N-acetylglucosamine synthase-like glycosyltransferase